MSDLPAPAAAPPIVRTRRLVLRPLGPADADAVFRMFSDPQVMRYWSHVPYTDPAEARDYIERSRTLPEDESFIQWCVARAEDDSMIGTCTLFRIEPAHRRAEIGYGLTREAWGQGYMTEALEAAIGYAFESLGLHRLEADVDPRNGASLRLLERLGFRREGTMRERWRVGGEVSDTAFFGLLAPEWRARA